MSHSGAEWIPMRARTSLTMTSGWRQQRTRNRKKWDWTNSRRDFALNSDMGMWINIEADETTGKSTCRYSKGYPWKYGCKKAPRAADHFRRFAGDGDRWALLFARSMRLLLRNGYPKAQDLVCVSSCALSG